MDEGMTLVSYKDGMKINKNNDGRYVITSATCDTVILLDLYKAEGYQIWGKEYAVRMSTANLVVMPEDD